MESTHKILVSDKTDWNLLTALLLLHKTRMYHELDNMQIISDARKTTPLKRA